MQDIADGNAFDLNDISADKSTFKNLRAFHFSQICFRLSLFIFCAVLSLVASGILTFFLSAIVMLLGLCLIVITLGYILIISPNFFNSLTSFTDGSSAVANFIFSLYAYVPYASAIGIVASILAIISLVASGSKNEHKGMFVFSIVAIVLFAIILLLTVFNVISATKGASV